MAQQVTKDTMIGDLLKIDAGVAPILLGIGMHCLGCPSSCLLYTSMADLSIAARSTDILPKRMVWVLLSRTITG